MSKTSKDVVIELARPEDAAVIVDIQKRTWLATYPNEGAGIFAEDTRQHLEGKDGELIAPRIERWKGIIGTSSESSATFVARLDGEAMGFANYMTTDTGQRRIGALYVLPDAQGYGLGGKLLQKAVDFHHQHAPGEPIFLEVASYNNNAIGFYGHYGFKATGKQVSNPVGKLPSGAIIPEIEMMRS